VVIALQCPTTEIALAHVIERRGWPIGAATP